MNHNKTMMNSVVMIACIFLTTLCFSTPAYADWEFQGSGEAFAPSNGILEKAVGGEVKLIYWHEPYWGLALCTGVSQWTVETTRDVVTSIPDTYEQSQTWRGNVQYVPIGLSVMTRAEMPDQGTLSLELGIRHMASTSNIEVLETDRVWTGLNMFTESTTIHPVDCPNGLVGRIGINAAWAVNDQLECVVAGGYQFDMDKSDATVGSLSIHKELNLTAFYVQLGLVLPLY